MQKQATIKVQSAFRNLICLRNFQQFKEATRLAVVIQSHIRGWIVRRGMHRLTCLVIRIQSYRRGYLTRREFLVQKAAVVKIQRAFLSRQCHKIFHFYREGATEIQRFIRGQIARRRLLGASLHYRVVPTGDILISGVGSHSPNLIIFVRYVVMLQRWWRDILTKKSGTKAAIIIQSHIRGWVARRQAMRERLCIAVIQRWWRGVLIQETRKRSIIVIQSYTRRWLARREATREKHDLVENTRKRSAVIIQSYTRQWFVRRETTRERHRIMLIKETRLRSAIVIQSYSRQWLARREATRERHVQNTRKRSAIIIQSYTRRLLVRRNATRERHCVTMIQRWWRNVLMRKTRIRSAIVIQSYTRRWLAMREAKRERHSLVQTTRMRSAVIIQSYTRRWLVRREAKRERHRITVIQSYWKGYLARKDSRGQLLDLRLRVLKSAANVDDSMRIINRLLAALSDLLDMKSVTGILHTCKTLDMATKHSQKCCEKLVEAGAIDTLLRLIRSVSRSIPDQEVLKHALSTLRNLARYPHLVEELIANHVSVTTIFLEFLRNKEEGYFVASELLKKICSNPKGVEVVSNSPALLKRLNILVEDLKRQGGNEKRNIRGVRAREQVDRRLREAVELLKLITSGQYELNLCWPVV